MNFCILSFFFHQYPGLFVIDVLIGAVGQGNNLSYSLVEFSLLIKSGNVVAGGDKISQQLGLSALWTESVIETFAQEASTATGDIDNLANDIRIYPLSEIIGVQVDIVYRVAELCGVVVA